MAINTANKRFSMMNLGTQPIFPLFQPSGSIIDGDKYHLLSLYSGITLAGVSAPVFTGTIPDISVTENTGTYTYDLSTYFTGATSYSISPAIEAGWTFNTATAELVIDTDDTNAFGPFTVTGTNTGGSAASNAFNVEIVTASIWADATTNESIWAVQNPTATTWDGGTTTWDFEGNVEVTSWDGLDDVWADTTNTPITWTKQ